eukprot:525680-Prymnesium_polylepis.1
MRTEEEAETEGRGEEHDLGGNCEWEGPGSGMRRRWSGRLWGSRSMTAERGKGDHIFASARAH